MKKAAFYIAGLIGLSVSAIIPATAIAAPTVTGVAGCIMKQNGVAGSVTGSTTTFEQCKTSSNSGNGNWISGNFVTAGEVNNAFNQLEKDLIEKITNTTSNLNFSTAFVDVTQTVSTNKMSTKSTKVFQGVINKPSEDPNEIEPVFSSGADAKTIANIFAKWENKPEK